jgi:hypothetical protein
MQVRKFDINIDYEDVKSWWIKQGWDVIPKHLLGITGFIAYDENVKYAACWLYRDKGCPISILEWTVGNPEVDYKLRHEALNEVMEECFKVAKEDGAELILTMTKNKRLIEKLKESQFVETDNDMTHLIRRL